MRILQFSLGYAPAWHHGGPPRILFDYARELVRFGHTVSVYTAAPIHGFSSAIQEIEGIQINYFHSYDSFVSKIYFNYSPSEIARWLECHLSQYDVVHIAQTRTLANIMMLRALQKQSIPYVFSAFGSLPRRTAGLKMLYDLFFVKPLISQARYLLAQTEHEQQIYGEYGGRTEQITLLPLTVHDSVLSHSQRSGQFRARWNIPEKAVLLLFLGRLHVTKGVDFLIEAFTLLATFVPQLFLAIVGHDCGQLKLLKTIVQREGVADRVIFTGPIFSEERFTAYRDSDLFVITPAVYEETSLASLEALACGTPVVTTKRSEVPWLETYSAGRIVEPDNMSSFTSAVLSCLWQEPTARLVMRENARRLVRERFSLKHISAQLEHLLIKASLS